MVRADRASGVAGRHVAAATEIPLRCPPQGAPWAPRDGREGTYR